MLYVLVIYRQSVFFLHFTLWIIRKDYRFKALAHRFLPMSIFYTVIWLIYRLHKHMHLNTAKKEKTTVITHTVTSESCSLVRFSGWLMAVIPNSTGLAFVGRKARRIALLATLMKATMACQPLLLYHTWQRRTELIEHISQLFDQPVIRHRGSANVVFRINLQVENI